MRFLPRYNILGALLASLSLLAEPFQAPLGLPVVPWPKENPYTREKSELGRLLYFDKRLSADGTISCATCHRISDGLADDKKTSIGIDGRRGTRNSQTIINAAYHKALFWDGRASSLEEQCKGPIANTSEMTNIGDPHSAYQKCLEHIKKVPGYTGLFEDAFGSGEITIDKIAMAIATFERTVLSGNSPYDRYLNGDKSALSPDQIQGYRVFKHVGCDNCHFGPNFADGRFLNIGVGMDAKEPDVGRYAITHKDEDFGAFRVPILREIERSAPYMHDGSLATLEEVIEYYDRGGIKNKNLHPLMRPLNLKEEEKQSLVSFLKALNGEGWQNIAEPKTFPQ